MDILITVSSPASADILAPLLRACIRRGCQWQVFFNHEGVTVLGQPRIRELLAGRGDDAIACHDSWTKFGGDTDCPVALGSQTNHSSMVGMASHTVSL